MQSCKHAPFHLSCGLHVYVQYYLWFNLVLPVSSVLVIAPPPPTPHPPSEPVLYENALAEQERRARSIVYGMSAGVYTKLLRLVIWLVPDSSTWLCPIVPSSTFTTSLHLSTFTHGRLACYLLSPLVPIPPSHLSSLPFLPLSHLPLFTSLSLSPLLFSSPHQTRWLCAVLGVWSTVQPGVCAEKTHSHAEASKRGKTWGLREGRTAGGGGRGHNLIHILTVDSVQVHPMHILCMLCSLATCSKYKVRKMAEIMVLKVF